jgi:hypothetical protein
MATATLLWPTETGATMAPVHINRRRLFVMIKTLRGQSVQTYWTDDGTATGTTVFSLTYMPQVDILLQGKSNRRAFTDSYLGGPLYEVGFSSGFHEYAWETTYDSTNSVWKTEIFMRGDVYSAAGGTSRADGEGDDAHIVAVLTAAGNGP